MDFSGEGTRCGSANRPGAGARVAAGPGDAAQAERRVEGSPWSRRSSASGNSDPGAPSDPAVE